MTPRPFLITGCGRSGTTWASHLFMRLGHWCGHEIQFKAARHGPLTWPESSWLAVPYLAELPEGTPVLRIMRNPYDVVRSTMARDFLHDMSLPYEQFAARHLPVLASEPDHLGRAIRWVTEWDEPVERRPVLHSDGYPAAVTHAVRLATGTMHTADEVAAVMDQLGNRINTNPPALVRANRSPTREEIDAHPLGWLVRARAKLHGYPTP